jgi:hypothetical protein
VNPTPNEYLARCHCGAVSARYRTAVTPAAWSVRACQCSFCRAHGALTVSDPAGSLVFAAAPNERLHRYRFGSRTTEFLLCRECGVYIGARIESAAGGFGVVNVRSLRPVPAELSTPVPMDYAEETVSAKRERRETRWTPLASESV